MKLAIIGSREFSDLDRALLEFDQHFESWDVNEIVSGGARGADTLAQKIAAIRNISFTCFVPDWDRYGKAAGFMRNETIVSYCDRLLAFWDGKSRGTGNSLSIAKRLKKPTVIIYF